MIKFETITGEAYSVECNPEETFTQIKENLGENYLFCDANRIHLLFEGSEINNESKLKTINLHNGNKCIVIYIEPDKDLPNIDEQIKTLREFNPDPKVCLETLQKFRYNILAASECLLEMLSNSPNTNDRDSNSNHFQYPQTNSQSSQGRTVQASNNPFKY